tara:strand:+ start:1733 stop:2782 length:1050 start_codon:yes stop_codon:yes gene_type:complete
MKVSIGTKIKEGPWGGGNLFALNLKNFLLQNGHDVVHNLNDPDIDIILLTEPRVTSESSAFTHYDVENYLKYINFNAIVIHRINECDERKNTKHVNKYMIYANQISDKTIFVSNWLKNIYINQGIKSFDNHVIYAGANKEIFNDTGYKNWDKKEKLKIVTHHWGANWYKGFETYLKIDELIGTDKWKKAISFTYIGNVPKNIKFKNSKIVEPLSGFNLANEIKKNHLYVTGSLNEPSGNHHIEAAQCGLPLLYINSGGIPEYCQEFGVKYEIENFESKLEEIISNYDIFVKKIKNYPNNSEKMSSEFLEIFQQSLSKKESIYEVRDFKKNRSLLMKRLYLIKKKIRNIL